MSIACDENFIVRRKSYSGTVSILTLHTWQNIIGNEGYLEHLRPSELLLTSCKFSMQCQAWIVIAYLLPKLFIVCKGIIRPRPVPLEFFGGRKDQIPKSENCIYESRISATLRQKCLACRALLSTCCHAGLLLSLFSDCEDGGETFLWNVSHLSTDYMVLCPRIWNSLQPLLWEPQILHLILYLILGS
jgi:hypothetical protein